MGNCGCPGDIIAMCFDLYHSPGIIYSPWGHLTEGLGAGGELAEGCGGLVWHW